MRSLKLTEEDCSAFGRLVLQHLKNNPQTNMSQLAKQVGLTHAGLSWVCLKRGSPSEETVNRIAPIIGIDTTKLARLIHENKLESLADLSALNYSVKSKQGWVSRKIPIEDAIAGLNAIFHAFHYVTRSIPELEKPTDFQIYKQAYDIVKRQFLKSKLLS